MEKEVEKAASEREKRRGRKEGWSEERETEKNLVLQRDVKSTKRKRSLQSVKNEKGIKKRSLSDTF